MKAYEVRKLIDNAMKRASDFNNVDEWEKENVEYQAPYVEYKFNSRTGKMYVMIIVKEED